MGYSKGYRSVYRLSIHLVLVTQEGRKVIDSAVGQRLQEIFAATCQKWGCALEEFKGEADHVDLLINFSPEVQLSKLVNNLKTVSSRLIRKGFPEQVSRLTRKNSFWSGAYFIASCGDHAIEEIQEYVKQQSASSE